MTDFIVTQIQTQSGLGLLCLVAVFFYVGLITIGAVAIVAVNVNSIVGGKEKINRLKDSIKDTGEALGDIYKTCGGIISDTVSDVVKNIKEKIYPEDRTKDETADVEETKQEKDDEDPESPDFDYTAKDDTENI